MARRSKGLCTGCYREDIVGRMCVVCIGVPVFHARSVRSAVVWKCSQCGANPGMIRGEGAREGRQAQAGGAAAR